jgi:hypothetical protein
MRSLLSGHYSELLWQKESMLDEAARRRVSGAEGPRAARSLGQMDQLGGDRAAAKMGTSLMPGPSGEW